MLALTELGRLHAPVIGSQTFADADWLNREAPINQALLAQLYAGFLDRYGDAVTADQRTVCQRLRGQLRRSCRRRAHGGAHQGSGAR